MKTTIKYNNFSSGLINKNLQGRFDLPLYSNSLKICNNFLINHYGGVEYRGGFVYDSKISCTNDFITINFKYSEFKDFIVKIFNDGKILIYSNSDGKLLFIQELNNNDLGNNYNDLSFIQYYNKLIITNYNMTVKELSYDGNVFTIQDFIYTVQGSNENKPLNSNENQRPSKVCFYNNRLVFVGTKELPTVAFFSDLNNINSFTFNLSSDENAIPSIDGFYCNLDYLTTKPQYLITNQNFLAVFSKSEVIIILANGDLTLTTIQTYKVDSMGIGNKKPLNFKNNILFFDSSNKNIKLLAFDFNTQSYTTQDISLYYNSYLENIIDWERKEDTNHIFLLKNDNKILTIKFDLTNQVNALSILLLNTELPISNIYNISRDNSIQDIFIDLKLDNELFTLKYTYNILPSKTLDSFKKFDKSEFETRNEYNKYISSYNLNLRYLDFFVDLTDYDSYKNVIFDFSDKYYLRKTDGSIWSKKEQHSQFKIYNNSGELLLIINTYKIDQKDNTKIEYEIKNLKFETNELPNNYILIKNIESFNFSNTIFYKNNVLKNIKLDIIGDGNYIGNFDISQNPIVDFEYLNKYFGIIQVGYRYDGCIATNNIGYDFNGQSTQITKKKINEAVVRFYNSLDGKIGTDFYNLQDIQWTDYNNITDIKRLPMDMDYRKTILDDYTYIKEFYIAQTTPNPLNIDAIFIKMDAEI